MLRRVVILPFLLLVPACDRADAAVESVKLAAGGAASARKGEIRLTVTNVREAEGTVRVALYDTSEGWKKDMAAGSTESYCRLAEVAPEVGEVETVFEGLVPGRYAIRLYHDLNDNLKVDKKKNFFVSMPSEPYGFTRNFNPVANMGTPSFAQCCETLEGGAPLELEIALR